MLQLTDFRYATRLLKKTPRFTLMTMLVLAGGLAISIYTYALLGTMMYEPLPIHDGASVVRIMGRVEGDSSPLGAFELARVRANVQNLRQIGAYDDARVLLSDDDASRSANATYAEWNVFEFARTPPLLGRGFVRDDNADGAEPVAVLGHGLWKAAFAGDPGVVDRVVRINRKPTRIVGVMPDGFSFPVSADLWLPLSARDLDPATYTDTTVSAYARLAAGRSAADARAELDGLLQRVQREHPRPNGEELGYHGTVVASFQLAQTGPEGAYVFAILNTVALFILLLACVNVGNMLLARTNERLREIAIRVALGAPRLKLVLQMMLESAIICVCGGALAVLLAGWILRATNRFMVSTFEGNLPFWWRWELDGGTVAAAAVFVVLAIVLVSALPTFTATNVSSNAVLRDGTRGARGRTSERISRLLVTVQIVLISVVVMVGSAMGIIAYRSAHIDFGIDTTALLTMPVRLDGESYATPEQQLLFHRRLLDELRRSPAIQAAMVSTPYALTAFAVDAAEYHTLADYPTATLVVASETPQSIGTQIVEGRAFDSRDNDTGMRSVVVSRTLAQTYWPGASAIGRRIRIVDEKGVVTEQRTVVGVVSDVRRGENLFTTDASTYAALYVPLAQKPLPAVDVVVKHVGDEQAARTALYRAVESVDANVAPGSISSYAETLNKLTLMATTMTDLFVRCGLFAILLALTGIYGLSSNAVVQRTHEIGLRRAVGASDGSIILLFLRQGSRQLMAGFAISAAISIAILYFIAQFAGVGALTLALIGALVAVLVSGLVLVAIYAATWRAVRPEPCVALRYE